MAESLLFFHASDQPARAAAGLLTRALLELVERHGRARLAIPGGSALAAVGAAREALGAGWSRVSLTWVDERCVASSSPDSNRGEAHRSGALRSDHPCALELPLFEEDEAPEQAAVRVDRMLGEAFAGAIDVNLLGLGEDGHIASLFPGRRWHGDGNERAIFVDESPKPPPRRISLTRDLLGTAPRSILVATGPEKAEALARLARRDVALPATGLPGLSVVTDQRLSGVEMIPL